MNSRFEMIIDGVTVLFPEQDSDSEIANFEFILPPGKFITEEEKFNIQLKAMAYYAKEFLIWS